MADLFRAHGRLRNLGHLCSATIQVAAAGPVAQTLFPGAAGKIANPRYTSRSPSAALPERSLAAELPGLPPCGQVACLRASQPQTRDEVRCCRTCALLTATSLLPSELSWEPTCWSKGLQGWREQKQPGPSPLPSWDDAWRKNASPSNVVECQCPGS